MVSRWVVNISVLVFNVAADASLVQWVVPAVCSA